MLISPIISTMGFVKVCTSNFTAHLLHSLLPYFSAISVLYLFIFPFKSFLTFCSFVTHLSAVLFGYFLSL